NFKGGVGHRGCSVYRNCTLYCAPALNLTLCHCRKDRNEREQRLMSKNWSNRTSLPAPVGALSEKKRGIPNDGCEGPSRCGITSERFRLLDKNFLNDIGVGHDQDIRQARPDACDALLVSRTRNRLDIVAQQRSQAEQAQRSFRWVKWNDIGVGKHVPHRAVWVFQ